MTKARQLFQHHWNMSQYHGEKAAEAFENIRKVQEQKVKHGKTTGMTKNTLVRRKVQKPNSAENNNDEYFAKHYGNAEYVPTIDN